MKNTGMLFPTMSIDALDVFIIVEVVNRTKVSFICIEPGRETVDISCSIGTSTTSSNGGESREHGRLLALCRKERRSGYVGPIAI
jgi:hypothetical protein